MLVIPIIYNLFFLFPYRCNPDKPDAIKLPDLTQQYAIMEYRDSENMLAMLIFLEKKAFLTFETLLLLYFSCIGGL